MDDFREQLGAGPPAGTLQVTLFVPSVAGMATQSLRENGARKRSASSGACSAVPPRFRLAAGFGATMRAEASSSSMTRCCGASCVAALPGVPSGGPLDLLQLRADVARRLQSSGGRPTDPRWNVQRLVPFQEARWRELEELADRLSGPERRVSPGQLAAILIERVLTSMAGASHRP